MITGAHFASMKPNACFINTARGAVVREQEMIEVLKQRADLYAILDVTHLEPPEPDSPLYALPNVVLTPHIAGSLDRECQRMGRIVVEELERYLRGEPLKWAISREQAARLAWNKTDRRNRLPLADGLLTAGGELARPYSSLAQRKPWS